MNNCLTNPISNSNLRIINRFVHKNHIFRVLYVFFIPIMSQKPMKPFYLFPYISCDAKGIAFSSKHNTINNSIGINNKGSLRTNGYKSKPRIDRQWSIKELALSQCTLEVCFSKSLPKTEPPKEGWIKK